MHAVRTELLRRQTESVGLPLRLIACRITRLEALQADQLSSPAAPGNNTPPIRPAPPPSPPRPASADRAATLPKAGWRSLASRRNSPANPGPGPALPTASRAARPSRPHQHDLRPAP